MNKNDLNEKRQQNSHAKNEDGEAIFKKFHSNKLSKLKFRINNKLAALIPLKKYPLTNVTPMVSFTFDDISENAAIYGAEILENANALGTFYVSTSMIGEHLAGSQKANVSDLQKLQANGHEIGLHTHKHHPILAFSKAGLEQDIEENKAQLKAIMPNCLAENFCYPYGVSSLPHKFTLKNKVRSARAIKEQANHHYIDPLYLNSYQIDSDSIDFDMLKTAFTAANKPNSWLILTSHQVSRRRERLSTTPDMLHLALKLTKLYGFDIVTIDQALNKINVPKLRSI